MARSPHAELGQRMMNQAFAVLAIVAVIAYFIYSGNVQVDEPVTLAVTTSQTQPSVPGKPFALELTLRLTNNTKEGMALTSPTQCDVLRWFITGKDKEFVQSQNDDQVCEKVTVSSWLDAQHSINETRVLQLDPARVRPGDYLIFVRYWGHEVEAPLTIK